VDSSRARWQRRIFGLRLVLLVVIAVAAGSVIALAFGLTEAEATVYSAYGDPDKPVLAQVLAGDGRPAEFQERFDLTDDEKDRVLTALREENDTLRAQYEASERMVDAARADDLSPEAITKKVARSGYEEKVRETVAHTKKTVEGIVRVAKKPELEAWVNGRFAEDARAAESDDGYVPSDAGDAYSAASTSGHSCGVWMSWYTVRRDAPQRQVALPHRALKFKGGYRVRITTRNGKRAWNPVTEAGPWNVRDNYWAKPRNRDLFSDLPRCKPEAEAAYYRNYHNGKDQFGRPVTSPAGIDITPGVAKKIGIWKRLRFRGLMEVKVYYPWLRS
jgi:hypothetical protein